MNEYRVFEVMAKNEDGGYTLCGKYCSNKFNGKCYSICIEISMDMSHVQ